MWCIIQKKNLIVEVLSPPLYGDWRITVFFISLLNHSELSLQPCFQFMEINCLHELIHARLSRHHTTQCQSGLWLGHSVVCESFFWCRPSFSCWLHIQSWNIFVHRRQKIAKFVAGKKPKSSPLHHYNCIEVCLCDTEFICQACICVLWPSISI